MYSKSIYLTTLTNDECNQRLGSTTSLPKSIDQSILCAFYKYGIGLCHGDAGTPLMQGPMFGTENILIGIGIWNVAESEPCGIGLPDQFTRISHYLSWIRKHVNVAII